MVLQNTQHQRQMPAKDCLFCGSPMNVNVELNALVRSEPPSEIVASEAVPVATYACPECGFIAAFNAISLGAPTEL